MLSQNMLSWNFHLLDTLLSITALCKQIASPLHELPPYMQVTAISSLRLLFLLGKQFLK